MSLRRLSVRFVGSDRRVIALPFIPSGLQRMRTLYERIDQLDEERVRKELEAVIASFSDRHRDILTDFRDNFKRTNALLAWEPQWSDERKLLAGAYFTMEYAIESAALFNPSIVPHPDQTDIADGDVRFVMSLRATGEGHVSSIVFRTGTIHADQSIDLCPVPKWSSRTRMSPDHYYIKSIFQRKLAEMETDAETIRIILKVMPEEFNFPQLREAVMSTQSQYENRVNWQQGVQDLLWLAQSNYHISLPSKADICEQVIFPIGDHESRGIEDLRLVRFTEDDGKVRYYGTYTAYNGLSTLPMLIETTDFHRIEIHSLNGACAINKGMGLFPRRIGGHYVMCSRIDGENLYIAYSDYVHFWETAERLAVPEMPWELVQLGNCGSPLETSEGWLLITHGVGPMRTYAIGAMLLDRDDPMRVIGHLDEPLLTALNEEREGYVPNVVYSCGSMIHGDHLYLPYAQADKSASVVVIDLANLLNRLLDSGKPKSPVPSVTEEPAKLEPAQQVVTDERMTRV